MRQAARSSSSSVSECCASEDYLLVLPSTLSRSRRPLPRSLEHVADDVLSPAPHADRNTDFEHAGQGDQGSPGRVSRADVASVAIAALDHREVSDRKTIELASKASDAVKTDQLEHTFDNTTVDA